MRSDFGNADVSISSFILFLSSFLLRNCRSTDIRRFLFAGGESDLSVLGEALPSRLMTGESLRIVDERSESPQVFLFLDSSWPLTGVSPAVSFTGVTSSAMSVISISSMSHILSRDDVPSSFTSFFGSQGVLATGAEGGGPVGGLMDISQVAGGPDHVAWGIM